MPAGGDLRAEAGQLVSLGATPVDAGQREEGQDEESQGKPRAVVMADPDGNEFRVLGSR